MFKGTLDATVVHPRDIFRLAILENASAFILVHNHPSGNCVASDQDEQFTEQIYLASRILGIELLDHVIIGDGYRSINVEHTDMDAVLR